MLPLTYNELGSLIYLTFLINIHKSNEIHIFLKKYLKQKNIPYTKSYIIEY